MIIIQNFITLPRLVKQGLLLLTDLVLLTAALWLSFSLRLGVIFVPDFESGLFWLFFVAPLFAIPIFIRFGLYRAIVRYLGMRAAWSVIQAVALYAVLWGLLAMLSGVPGVPRAVILINAMVTLLAIGGIRVLARWLLSLEVDNSNKEQGVAKTRCVIFGAGNVGRQLAVGLQQSREYSLSGFVDDSPELQGRDLMGAPILSLDQLKPFINQNGVTDMLLAIPSISRKARNQIIERLRPFPLRVRTLPGLVQMAQGEVNLSDLHELDVNDLLGREPTEPDEALLKSQVAGKCIAVTGAGGSIGSEICRQVLRRWPRLLILIDSSEPALYQIKEEMERLRYTLVGEGEGEGEGERRGISLVPKIIDLPGSIADEQWMTQILQTWKVDTIYHAAARKHVPSCERNVSDTLINNIVGSLTVAKVAILNEVSNVVLISTDKAVRPTNLMGASKRVSEMILQALVDERAPLFESLGEPPLQVDRKTHFSMVRFGNVLDSSGSVVPKFREQISRGGPITLTHKEVTRYFMTIPEAAQLVMQAGALGKVEGGEDAAAVFILEMGESVRIYDLACRMVELSGKRVKSEECPEGDIEIKVVGLREGEKLYEELLIGDNPMPTAHPKIMKAHEEFIPWRELQPKLNSLQIAAQNYDVEMCRAMMQQLVKGYTPDEVIADHLYREQTR